MSFDLGFYKGKRVFVTGHTGFKGSWLCKLLVYCGADVTGYALKPDTIPELFSLMDVERDMNSVIGDIRDFDKLQRCFNEAKPEVVLHLAAQPLVRESYKNPRYTYDVNVNGTVNILDCVRGSDSVCSVVNVTTDKVYENTGTGVCFTESDRLCGFDPYSNSKSCSELVTYSFKNSFLDGSGIAVSTARAGNVIGGGDFAADRILPDCVRAVSAGRAITVRNPYSVRPYQFVLEPLCVYLMLAARQSEDKSLSGCYNVGPDEKDCITTGELADLFCAAWGEGASWLNMSDGGPHEAGLLRLDCSVLKDKFGWSPVWDVKKAVEATVGFAKEQLRGGDISAYATEQIKMFLMAGDAVE